MTPLQGDAPATFRPFPYEVLDDPDVSDCPAHQQLRDWWQRLRGDAAAPLRSKLDPLELRAHLGSLALMERLDGVDDYLYRLIGTRIVEAFGRDSTGKTLTAIYGNDPVFCNMLLDVCRTVVTRAIPVRALGDMRTIDRAFLRVDSYFLPLAREDGSIGWILNQVAVEDL